MNLQQQVAEKLAHNLRDHIDFEVLVDMLCTQGWHRVDLERFQDNKHAVDIAYWIQDNCRGRYHAQGSHWVFESKQDAVLFKLKWV